MRICKAFWLLFIGMMSLGVAHTGLAQSYPSKVIRVIVPFPPGGSDLLARALQRPLGKALGGTVIVENIPGASGKIGTMDLIKSAPDGHTLLLLGDGAVMSYYYSGAYDSKVWEQMTVLGQIGQMAWGMLEVRADSPFKTWADVVSFGKKNPGKLNAGGPSPTGMMPLIVLESAKSAGIDVTYVPFGGPAASLTALLGGHVDYRVAQASDCYPNIRAGKTRGLAVTFSNRVPEMPDVPTFKELGIMSDIPVFGYDFWGPANLPAGLANQISKAIEQAIKDPEYIEMTKLLAYQPVFVGPEALRAGMRNFEKNVAPRLEAAFPRK